MRPKFVLATFILLLCSVSFISYFSEQPFEDYTKNKGNAWEEYDPSYFYKFQSIKDIITDADQHFPLQKRNSLDYYDYVAEILRKRFYHGYSHYNMSTNPLAFLAGKLIWSHLSAIVIPDDIMKHPMAACSQQAIIMMEIFKRNGVDFRKVGFTGHFTSEGRIEGQWKYFDTDLEPNFGNRRESLRELIASNRFDSVYSNVKLDPAIFQKVISHPRYGRVNAAPAPNASLFHQACYFLESKFFLTVCFLFTIIYIIGLPRIKEISLAYKEKIALVLSNRP